MPTVTEQIIEVQVKGAGDIAKQLSAGTDRASKNLVRDMDKVAKLVAKTFRKAPDEMLKSGGMKEFVKRFQEIQKGQVKAAEIVRKLQDASLSKEEKKRLNAQLKREQKAIRTQQDLLKEEASSLTKWGQRRKAIAEEAAKLHTRTLADGIEGAFNKIQAGDLRGLTDAITGGVAKAGGKMRKVGGKMGAPGAGKAMKAMGAAAAGIGAAVGAIAAVAAAVAAVVAIFISLDNRVKDFNKELVQSTGAMDLTFEHGYRGAKAFREQLDLVRKAAHDTNNNLKWMTMPKEQLEILKAFNEAGYRIKDMTKGLTEAADKMQRLQDVTSVALTYSRLMGVSTQDIATNMGELMFQTGLGLDQITEGFGKVAKMAQDSGFNVKRFYSTVLEVTSGMGFYNIRLEEAGKLLDTFTKALGKGPGTEFFKEVKEGFDDMSYKERVKQIMVTGGKEVRKILDAESEKAASRFWKEFGENKEVEGALKAVGDEFGLSLSGGKDLAQSLAKLSEKEYTKLVTELRHGHGISGEVTNELERIRMLTKGSAGSLGDQAKALDDMSETGALAMKMTSFMGKSLHEYSLVQLMGFEEMKGISGDQLKKLQIMSREFHGAYGALQEMSEKTDEYGISSGAYLDEMDKKSASLLKQYGAAVDEQGKIRKATIDTATGQVTLGEEINNLQEFIVKQNQVAEAAAEMTEEQLTKDQMLAQQVVANTEPLTKILSITIAGWLERIHASMAPVAGFLLEMIGLLPGGDEIRANMEAADRQAHMIETATAAIQEAQETLGSGQIEQQKTDLKKFIEVAKEQGDTNWVEGLQKQLEAVEQTERDLKATIEIGKKEKQLARKVTPEQIASGEYFKMYQKEIGAMREKDPELGASLTGEIPDVLEKNQKAFDYYAKYYAKDAEARDKKLSTQMADQKQEAKEQKERDDDLLEKTPTDEEIAKAMTKEQQNFMVESVLAQLGYTEGQIGKMSEARRRRVAESGLGGSRFAGLSEYTKGEVAKMAIHAGLKAPQVGGAAEGTPDASPDDFILTDAGRMIEPNPADTLMGMKPGGPLSKLLGGGGGAKVNVTIYESHNVEKTYATVKRALRDAGLTN